MFAPAGLTSRQRTATDGGASPPGEHVNPSDPNLIVGIGGSAGGIAALEILFRGLPPDTGMAFVIVTHQARGHESALPSILGRFTAMPVAAAADGDKIAPDHVYVCPPDHQLTIQAGRLRL